MTGNHKELQPITASQMECSRDMREKEVGRKE
jgi:hypothetical protein